MNWKLLHKYLAEECSSQERRIVEEWMNADEKHRQILASLEKIWKIIPADEVEESTFDENEAWQNVKKRMDGSSKASASIPSTEQSDRRPYSHRKSNKYNVVSYLAVAASVVVLIATLFYFKIDGKSQMHDEIVYQEVKTQKGQLMNVRLPDGTIVKLNTDSELSYPKRFTEQGPREVSLKGEAFFEVKHDPDKPFLVHSGNVSTEVLGTKFGVMAYPDDEKIEVVVSEGKIKSGFKDGGNKQERLLTKNQLASFSNKGRSDVYEIGNLDAYIGWKDGKLFFRNTPFSEVEKKLERWYDSEITLSDTSLQSKTLTATFEKESLKEVLNVIALSMDINYEQKDNKVEFTNK